ncbi:MAG: ComEC family competence protein, partial [Deltaproteobacteria bacterium]|nr:ComEC family competence protein [Deltaproteobacteria bacterium]
MRHRLLIPLLFSYILGILLGQTWYYIPPPLPLYFPVPVILILVFLLKPVFKYRFPLHNLLFFLIGFLFTAGQYPETGLSHLARERKNVTIEGTVLAPPRFAQHIARFDVRAENIFIHGHRINAFGKLLVSVYQHPQDLSPGERIRFPAVLRAFENFNNPGRYDYETAQRLKGYAGAASVPDGRRIVPMGKGKLGVSLEIIESIKKPARSLFQRHLSDRHRAIFQALILAEKHGVTPEMREPFNITGLGHILAVSGLHIGMVAWLVFLVIRGLLSFSYRLTLKWHIRKVAAILTCIPDIVYTAMTGFQVSSQRAMIMVLSYLFSIILGREKEVWSTLALAALVILVVDPHAIFT